MKAMPHSLTTTAARRVPCASLFLSAMAVLVFVQPSAGTWLQYDRRAIAGGEIWRLVSSHWTHVSADHLFWDVLTFLLLGTLCEQINRLRFCTCVLASTIIIPVALWTTMPQLWIYRGLSGIDSALYLLLAVTLLKDEIQGKRWAWVIALLGALVAFVAKAGYEITTGGIIFVNRGASHMIPVPLAHCAGAVVGTIVGLMPIRNPGMWCVRLFRQTENRHPSLDSCVARSRPQISAVERKNSLTQI